jgi:NAD+ synthase (glutamine-hydrolysing)
MSSRAQRRDFGSLYSHGFARVAVAVPQVRIAEPEFNALHTVALAQRAAQEGALLAVFPELGLSGYSIEDLLHQQALLGAVCSALQTVVEASQELACMLVVGAPLLLEGAVFNTAVVVYRGRVLAVYPKSYLPEYREYYEKRQFRAARDAVSREIMLLGERVPFGADLVLHCSNVPNLALHVEICEDLWTPIPPSTYGAMAGATVLINLSASNITIGKAEYRHSLCAAHSGRTVSGYIYTAAGLGESTTDLAWDGQAMIYENSDLLAEAERFAEGEQVILADLDLDRIVSDRAGLSSFADTIHDHLDRVRSLRRVEFELALPEGKQSLRRTYERFPFVPSDPITRNERCEEVYNIQVRGLETRLRATGIQKVVIGVSGGLDSTHALIVAARAMDRIGLSRQNVLGYTMPGFATSGRTRSNAVALMEALGVTAHEIDIRPSAKQMLSDLEHPASRGEHEYDVTYENVQAGERTSHLFRLANYHRGLVLGTGDLSELALGWSTYGVGDQMSHYNVNASVPKSLIQFMIRWAIDTRQFSQEASQVLSSILETKISPELVPTSDPEGDEPEQDSEQAVGPYELQDFFLYYILRFGYSPPKVAFLAHHVWGDRTRGPWPDLIPAERRNEYSLSEIKHWLGVFLERFFHTSQFKRSALPNGPKVGSGGALSPRGDWRAPSDSTAKVWLDELDAGVPDKT